MSEVVKRDEARRDLLGCFIFIGEERPDAADRFLIAAEATIQRLAQHPGMGEPYRTRDPKYASVRRSRISRFKIFLIYYQPIDGGIEVLRVVHGARDQPKVFGPDEE
jgi:toxin ParE1/3/4